MKLRELAALIGGRITGDPEVEITGVAGIENAKEGDITFLQDLNDVPAVAASALIVKEEIRGLTASLLVAGNPQYTFARALEVFYVKPYSPYGISDRAVIGSNVKMGDDVSVYPNVYIGNDVELGSRVTISPGVFLGEGTTVGDDSFIHPNVTIREKVKIGRKVIVHSGAVIGSDGFGYVLEKGRHSVFVTPCDFGNLCRVQVEQGDLDAAADTLKKNKSALQASPEGQLVLAVTQGIVHAKSGNTKEAEKVLDAAAELRASGVHGDARLMLDLAGICMAGGRHDEADSIVAGVARNAHDSEALLAKARDIYEAAGRNEAGAAVLARATADVRKLNNEGVMLAQRGDFKTAVEKLMAACAEAPHNPRILMNAVWVALKYIDQAGMDETLIGTARRHLADAERQAPGHARIAGLRLHLSEVENRFGIRRKAAG